MLLTVVASCIIYQVGLLGMTCKRKVCNDEVRNKDGEIGDVMLYADIIDFVSNNFHIWAGEDKDTTESAMDVLICLAVAEQRKIRSLAKENQKLSVP
jgi:hypothetical protein